MGNRREAAAPNSGRPIKELRRRENNPSLPACLLCQQSSETTSRCSGTFFFFSPRPTSALNRGSASVRLGVQPGVVSVFDASRYRRRGGRVTRGKMLRADSFVFLRVVRNTCDNVNTWGLAAGRQAGISTTRCDYRGRPNTIPRAGSVPGNGDLSVT